jgi:hypothetical protein
MIVILLSSIVVTNLVEIALRFRRVRGDEKEEEEDEDGLENDSPTACKF